MERVRSTDGTTIAFERVGAGPPLILVGGALSDRSAAGELATALSERLTAVAYDRRGRGDSGDTPPYAVEREVEDLQALIAEAGGSSFLFGHSSGAALVLETAARGGGAERIALYEPPYNVDDTRTPVPADYVSHLDELVAEGRRGDAVEYFMVAGVGMPAAAVAMATGTVWNAPSRSASGPSRRTRSRTARGPPGRTSAPARPAPAKTTHDQAPIPAVHSPAPSTTDVPPAERDSWQAEVCPSLSIVDS